MVGARAIHIPADVLREYLVDIEPLVKGAAAKRKGDSAAGLAEALAQVMTAEMAKDPRFLRSLLEQMNAVIPRVELLRGLESGSLHGLLARYFPGGFSD